MIQLDKQTTPIINEKGETIGWNTQAVLLPNHFFLDPGIVCDWVNNTCTLDGNVYYLDKSVMKSSSEAGIPSEEEWLNTYGNRIQYEYYDFVDMSGNPSGNQNNIYRSKYIDNRDRIKYIIEYIWDINDNCLSMISIAPDGAEAEQEKVIVVLTKYGFQGKKTVMKCVKGDTMYIAKEQSTPNERFEGWMLNGELLPTNENGAAIIVMNDNYEINAHYIKTFTIIWMDQKRQVGMMVIDDGAVVNPYDISCQDTAEKYFDGWYYKGERQPEAVVIQENTTFTSQYLPWLLASIDRRDGETTPAIKFRKGESLTFDTLNAIIPEGTSKEIDGQIFTLEGWYYGDQRFGEDMPELVVEDNVTVWAHWINPDEPPTNEEGGE